MTNFQIGQFSFRLFRRPSFLGGFVGLVDFSDNISRYKTDVDGKMADARSLNSDWQAVGKDLRESVNTYEQSRKSESITK